MTTVIHIDNCTLCEARHVEVAHVLIVAETLPVCAQCLARLYGELSREVEELRRENGRLRHAHIEGGIL